MKKLLSLALMALAMPLLLMSGGCANNANPGGEEYVLTGIIIAVGDRIEIEITSGEYAEGIYHIIHSGAEILDEEGRPLSLNELSAGDEIEVVYGGQVMMSYPPQVAAIRISKI